MGLTIERRIRTRGYELDQEGRIPPAALLRYLEHLRWEAITEAPDVMSNLFHGGGSFVVVAQRLEVIGSVALGAELDCTMQVGRVGHSSLDFHHQIRLAGEELARAVVTAVFLDPGGRPAPVPEALRAAVSTSGPALVAMAPPTPAPANTWSRPLEVRPSDTDILRHTNHASYLVFCEDVRRLAGLAGAYGAHGAAAVRPARRLALSYLRQALQGELLTVHTWVMEAPPPLALGFELRREGEPLCRARIEVVAT